MHTVHRDKLIKISAPPSYIVGADNDYQKLLTAVRQACALAADVRQFIS